MKRPLGTVLALVAALALIALPSVAQVRLVTGGAESNFGRQALRGGFMPDPWVREVTSGGNLDARSLGIGADCRGFVTAEPDVILDYTAPRSFLRFYAVAQGDSTLVVRTPDGRWLCNDDDARGGSNPVVDVSAPPAGQYDIWVGSYRAGENLASRLHVTEMRSRRP